MTSGLAFDKIELSLIRAFHTVITERSVSRAALQLHSSQPAVSAQLKRLRGLVGDPLLVRAGSGMAPTAVALSLLPAAQQVLQGAQALFGGHAAARVLHRRPRHRPSASPPVITSTRCSCPSWWRGCAARRRASRSTCCR
jgi:DNA-binding transcriptional LysR family regulator